MAQRTTKVKKDITKKGRNTTKKKDIRKQEDMKRNMNMMRNTERKKKGLNGRNSSMIMEAEKEVVVAAVEAEKAKKDIMKRLEATEVMVIYELLFIQTLLLYLT